jgi:hypothetical protein
MGNRLRGWLEGSGAVVFSVFAATAAFTAYFAMYAFRKPWAAGTYTEEVLIFDFAASAAPVVVGALPLKTALIISQVLGYALSKWLGVKFVSELPARRRPLALLFLIGWAELALVVFALVPPSGRVVAIFFNGLPLGAVWGLVFGFLEGRRTSEILGAGLSASYIVASGAVKSVGLSLHIDFAVSEAWMPAVTGLIFLPIFLVAVWALSQLPSPSKADIAARTQREPMKSAERRGFFFRFLSGLFALTALYFFLTAYRDFRDNFAVEIWRELGMGDTPAIMTWSELPIAAIVLLALGALYLIQDNRRGLLFTHVLMTVGMVVIGVSTLLFDLGIVGGTEWMIMVGLGLYLGYVPYGCVLFDRMIAATGVVATSVFMIYLTDAAGYIGSIGVLLFETFGELEMSKLGFLRYFSYFTSIFCAVCFIFSGVYFHRRSRPTPTPIFDEDPHAAAPHSSRLEPGAR